MAFIRTPTPPYKGQPNGTRPRETGILDWLAALFRTPTPAYKTAPVEPAPSDVFDPGTPSEPSEPVVSPHSEESA